MAQFGILFIISQILVFFAMIFDFLSLQFKKRKRTMLCFIVSAILISAHYFLLFKITAGIIVFISVLRFITCYFTTNKKFLYLFILLNTIVLIFTYKELSDLLIYTGVIIFTIGSFQQNNALMRKIMMVGTSLIIIYDLIIFSPVGAIMEASLLISNFIGYYRHYVSPLKTQKA